MESLMLELARMGDDAAYAVLERRYRGMLWNITSDYYAPGLTSDDLLQAARIGFWKAIHDWKGSESTFAHFAHLCVSREVITMLKTATRGKHSPLNDAMSFALPMGHENEKVTLGDMLPAAGHTAAELLELASAVDEVYAGIDRLTPIERCAVELVAIDGETYALAAEEFGRAAGEDVSPKAIDNALQRARRKLRRSAGSALAACP